MTIPQKWKGTFGYGWGVGLSTAAGILAGVASGAMQWHWPFLVVPFVATVLMLVGVTVQLVAAARAGLLKNAWKRRGREEA